MARDALRVGMFRYQSRVRTKTTILKMLNPARLLSHILVWHVRFWNMKFSKCLQCTPIHNISSWKRLKSGFKASHFEYLPENQEKGFISQESQEKYKVGFLQLLAAVPGMRPFWRLLLLLWGLSLPPSSFTLQVPSTFSLKSHQTRPDQHSKDSYAMRTMMQRG